jgi:hypothetical protein
MMKTKMILMTAAVAFALATGNAQAYENDYNVQHVGDTVTFTSALDQKSYFVSAKIFDQAQEEGVKLALYLEERAAQNEPPMSLDDCRVLIAGDAMKIFGRSAVYVKFYMDVAIEMAWHEMKRVDAENEKASQQASRPTSAEASVAMNRLQDAKGKPHVSGVWYHPHNDTYNWIGPKFGRPMSDRPVSFWLRLARISTRHPRHL